METLWTGLLITIGVYALVLFIVGAVLYAVIRLAVISALRTYDLERREKGLIKDPPDPQENG